MTRFTHLHTHSHYSLLDGLAKIEELVAEAKSLGMDSLAITDHGNLYGAIEFYKAARAAGIKPILGVEAYIAPGSRTEKTTGKNNERYYHLILLAENNTGWKNLIKLVTRANIEGFYYKPRMDKEILREHHEGIIALSACLAGEVSRAITRGNYEEAKRAALEYQDIFGVGNFFLELGHHPGIKETLISQAGLRKIASETGIPIIATQDIHYLHKEDAATHDVLLAVQTGNTILQADRLTLRDDDFSMRSPEEMATHFKDEPDAITNSAKIADRCNVEIKLGEIQLPKFPLPDGVESRDHMRQLISERLPKRFSEITPQVTERIDFELSVIEKMNFADYFLIVQDFINWAKDRGIVVGPGRGSAAGSLVSYVLGITDVDPIKYDLLFERFLNPERIQMPDIDVDITDRRRDEVFGYLQEKYGMDHVAHIITFGTMAARASIRDVGRALGVSYGLCDQLAKLIPFNQDLEEALGNIAELKELYDTNEDAKRIIDIAKKFEGVARHASVHACGTVISKNPLTDQLPLQLAPQDESVVVTQFEMHSVEDMGLLKMDLLGLKNLTIIEDTLRLINYRKSPQEILNIQKIPTDDPRVFDLLQKGNTTGVFQLESSGMRRYLKELKPNNLEDIVAMVALYRPGPMDLIPDYINVKHGRKQVDYLHPKLEPILGKTYGVGVYQEQMMRIARDLAGFTLAEADTLRKAIGKKIKSLLDKQKEKLVAGMVKNEIPEATALAIWELFPPFARYGFNRSHAVCYAWVGYQTAYLKAHYPIEFMTSLLNNDAGDIERTGFLVTESKHSGIDILPPDINISSHFFTPEGNNIRFGLSAIKNVGEAIVSAIITEREARGPFKSLSDLLYRIQHKDLNKKSIEALTKCGAVDSLGFERNLILGNIDDIVRFGSALKKSLNTNQSGLFGVSAPAPTSLKIKAMPPAETKDKLIWEKELLGLYISDHPLNIHRERLAKANVIPIGNALLEKSEMKQMLLAGIVTRVQKIVTKKGKPMLFSKIEDMTNSIEIVVFPETYAKTINMWRIGATVILVGKMDWQKGEPKLICDNGKEL